MSGSEVPAHAQRGVRSAVLAAVFGMDRALARVAFPPYSRGSLPPGQGWNPYMNSARTWISALSLMAFAACSFAPDYKRPELDVPAPHSVEASTDSIPWEWRTLFGD